MAVDFDAWAKLSGKDRVLLVEVKVYTSGSEITRYLSTKSANDFGYYQNVIESTPTMSRSMDESFGGESLPSFGSLEILNDGTFDDWVYDSWGGRDIAFFLGDPSWDRADFEQVFSGTVDSLEMVSDSKIKINVRGKESILNAPISEDLFTSGEADGKNKPVCFGTVYNITPVLIVSGSSPDYQIHPGAVEDVCVQLYVDGEVSGITVTKDNANGTFSLASDPNGTVTCDSKGAKPSTFLQKPGEIIEHILDDFLGFTGTYATDTISDFDTTARTVGFYSSARVNALDVITLLTDTRLGYFGFRRDGKFELGALSDPSGGTSVLDIDSGESFRDIVISIEPVPRYRSTVGYKKNWTVQTETGNDSTDQPFISTEYREESYTDAAESTIKTQHLDSIAGEPENTMIDNITHAIAEATSRQGLFNEQRYRIKINAFASGYLVDIGNVGTITDDRYSLSSKKFLITDINDDFANFKVTLEGWF
jgi:hypothetical protein